MANCAIVGINWGDVGKGRMVDLLTEDYDVVVRFQGGGNAGHTVINELGKFALHLLPSGDIYKESYNNTSINPAFGRTSNLTLFEENVYSLKDNQIKVYNNNSGDFVNMIHFGHDVETESNVSLVPGDIEYPIVIDANNFVLYNKKDKFVLITKNE